MLVYRHLASEAKADARANVVLPARTPALSHLPTAGRWRPGVDEEHREAGHGSAQGLPRASYEWHHRAMDDTPPPLGADRCFDRAYRAVLRQVTPKPANGQVPGPRAKTQLGKQADRPSA